MTVLRRGVSRLDEALGRPVSFRAMALLRILVGPIVLLHLRPFLDDAANGHIYRDSFYQPFAAWYPELPRSAYGIVLVIGAVAAVSMTLGLLTRVAVLVAFTVVTYNVFLSTTHMHNNRAYLIIVLGVLSLAPCGRELSVDALVRRRLGKPALDPCAPAWPLYLLRFEASVVYGASGFSKLVDRDWFGGTVTWGRLVSARERIDRVTPFPDWFITVLTNRSVHTYAAKVIVLTELFIACALWVPRARTAAVWVAVWFHVAIQLTASVDIFSYLAISALAIWTVPTVRDRMLLLDDANPAHRVLRRAVRTLDWLGRFRIAPAPIGASVTLVDRDGTQLTGRAAVATALSRLPLTAMVALPIAGWTRHERRGVHTAAA